MTIESRRIRVTIKTNEGDVLVINPDDSDKQLTVSFNCISTTTPSTNSCRILIRNLGEGSRKLLSSVIRNSVELLNVHLDIERRSFLGGLIVIPRITFDTSRIYERGFAVDSVTERGDTFVTVEAGYGKKMAVIFEGSCQRLWTVKKGTEWHTNLRVGDGEATVNGGVANKSFPPGTKFLDVVKYLIATMGLESGNVTQDILNELFRGDVVQFVGGQDVFGKSSVLMDHLFKLTGAEWFIDRGQVYFTRRFESLPDGGLVLSDESGLKTAPEEVQGDMVEARSFLRPDMRIGRPINLIHKRFGGNYRIELVNHNGTNRFGILQTRVRLSQVRQRDIRI